MNLNSRLENIIDVLSVDVQEAFCANSEFVEYVSARWFLQV